MQIKPILAESENLLNTIKNLEQQTKDLLIKMQAEIKRQDELLKKLKPTPNNPTPVTPTPAKKEFVQHPALMTFEDFKGMK